MSKYLVTGREECHSPDACMDRKWYCGRQTGVEPTDTDGYLHACTNACTNAHTHARNHRRKKKTDCLKFIFIAYLYVPLQAAAKVAGCSPSRCQRNVSCPRKKPCTHKIIPSVATAYWYFRACKRVCPL